MHSNTMLMLTAFLLIVSVIPPCYSQGQNVLPFLPINATTGVTTEAVGHFDDGVSHVIHISGGFPIGNRIHNLVYIGTNGYFSFGQPFYEAFPETFPGFSSDVSTAYLVAPYWDDIDIRRNGNVFYEVHSTEDSLLSQVSNFITNETVGGEGFSGTWMLLAQWDHVHSWPNGEDDDLRDFFESIFGLDSSANNTFQAIVITDGTRSYSVFTYKCGELQWSYNGPTIGYNAGGAYFKNHPNTGSFAAHEIACLNSPQSDWYNVVYNLSVSLSAGTLAPPPTVEPPQTSYLEYLEYGLNTLPPCRNCSSPAIDLGGLGIPFGNYYHTTAYVGTNGIISFGRPFPFNNPATFPTQQADTYFSYFVAAHWSDIDTRLAGAVRYQTYSSQNSSEAHVISTVEAFVNSENGTLLNSNWMLVATWKNVHPFPHGASADQDRQDPYLQSTNTFQAIIISNGTKTYSVFTYNCNDMGWSDAASIGYNAGGDYYDNHPLSGEPESRVIGCVHTPGSVWNNVVFDLSPVEAFGSTPPPLSSLGSCEAAGYTECCTEGLCFGQPEDCSCDQFCTNFGDCCHDQPSICDASGIDLGNETYVVYADHFYIGRLSLDGSTFETLPLPILDGAFSVDFDYRRDYLYWTDYITDAVFRSCLDGSNVTQLVNTTNDVVEGLAVDWVSNKLYWTESLYRRIEVLDLDTLLRTPILTVDPHSGLRDIAVDPSTRYMYWADWGEPAKIERASMDGTGREVLHNTGLSSPEGITIDYVSQTVYWTDYRSGVIEYSNTDGTNRRQLQSGLTFPQGITVHDSLVYWTDLDGVSFTDKLDGVNVSTISPSSFILHPAGIQVISLDRQSLDTNFCENSSCAHMCLLSATDSRGYSCMCRNGYSLDSNGENCTYVGTSAPPVEGTCGAGGYNVCCVGGYCAGTPPTCYCDELCRLRGDCCSDIDISCAPEATSCLAAGYDTCCTNFSSGCAVVAVTSVCYCDSGCYVTGDCCDDIEETCQLTNTSSTSIPPTGPTFLEFFTLNTTEGVNTESVGHFDDGVSHAIHLPQGIRFGSLHHTFIFISTNGIISFGEPFYVIPPVRFPSSLSTVSGSYLVAPFWSDVDITMSGNIHYEVHMENSSEYSSALISVSQFVSRSASVDFLGTWMLVVSWESVHPWPNGIAEALPIFKLFYPDYDANNTYQAIIITDGVDTYSVFTYKCGEMEWARNGMIGYNAGGESFRNHPTSGETGTPSIACLNSPDNEWVNVVYQLNVDNPTQPPEPATVEPPQSSYLPMLDFTGQAVVSGILQRCQNCTSGAINITSGFPFGSYYHDTVFVGTNGIISFDREFRNDFPEAFPSEADITVYSGYLVAPYWSNIDTRLEGQVRYEVFQSSDGGNATGGRLQLVTDFISSEFDPDFVGGSWMLVATWRGVHPAPHGDSAEQDREDPYLQSTNTFQAVLISNGTKAYAVFTYTCDNMQWSDEATIGFNAAGTLYKLHPLSGRLHANAIDCVHILNGSFINNVIFDLAPEEPEGTVPPITERNEIPFIIGITEGVTNISLPSFDDGASDAILIDLPGFPFANSYQTVAYVGTNGVISFGRSFIQHTPVEFPSAFPEVYTSYILAPFWADVDITRSGAVYYETHTMTVPASRDLLDRVSSFITFTTEEEFQGTWMLIALWDDVPPYTGGFPGLEANSFQGIAITNGNQSYAVYTYRCGHLDWSNEAVIGFNGGSSTDYFVVHPLSGSDDAQSIACKEFPDSEWTNVVYKVSIENVVTEPPLSTSEPPQSLYLPFLEKTGINQGVLTNCDDCHSNEIDLSSEPFPFGNYTHQVAFVSTNGIISFGKEFIYAGSRLFPSSTVAGIHYSYVLAPYWSDIDTRDRGEVWYETHFRNQNSTSDRLLDQVSSFINNQTDASGFIGTLMIVVKWDSVPPYTGEGGFFPTVSSNTFQAVLITNGTKSYAIYTYKCDLMEWSNEATIGYNAAGDFYLNHPFSGTELSDDIDCVHRPDSVWNNEVYDLVPGELREGPTPPPIDSFGSCALAGFTECCQGFDCFGSAPGDCFCDGGCFQFGDCCSDIQETCEPTSSSLNATLVIANQHTLTLINGSSIETLLVNDQSALYIAVDYDYQRGYLYYSDTVANTISRAGLDGSNPEVIVDSVIEDVDGISVDWINNKLYWTDAVYTRIEVIDLETFNRKLLFVAGPHTAPRAIAVDPSTRYMYWTDWGEPAKIERASMDGTGREVLHSTGLIWPNGITIDYHDQRIYWADASLDRIEYSNVDGSQRVVLETEEDGLSHPFGLTLHNDILYWTDWNELAVYMTHKVLGETILPVYENLAFLPSGIEAISPDRQQQVSNPCDGHTCSYLCLLSSTATVGYSCACPDGSALLGNGRDCSNVTTPSPPTPSGGSCAAAGYDRCCSGGLCYGSPPTCFCEESCTFFGDCCEDFDVICGPETTTDVVTTGTTEMQTTTPITTISTTPPYDCNFDSPSPVRNLSLFPISASTLNITWMFPVTNTPGLVCLDDSFSVIIKTFSGDSVFQATVAGEETSVLAQGLERWILYNISVVANNMYGPSDPVYAAIFTEEGIPPIPPANVDINRTSTTEMTVSWDLLTPQQATGFITSYTVVYTEVVPTITRRRRQTTNTKVEVEVEVAPDKNRVTIDNLSPDDSYTVSVRANTAAGKGVNSDPITSSALTVTGAPNVAGPVDGGAVAGGLVFAVIVVVCVVALGVVLVMVLRRRKKTGDSEDYARFNNEEQSIAIGAGTQSDSYQPDLINQKQKPTLEFAGTGNVVTTGYRQLEETGAPAFENPTYGKLCDVTGEEVKRAPDGEEARYAEVKKKQTNEESAVYDVPASPLPGLSDEAGYEVVKEDLSKKDPVYDEVQKDVTLNEYERMDEL